MNLISSRANTLVGSAMARVRVPPVLLMGTTWYFLAVFAGISFRIPEPGHVKLLVYNQLGQMVTRLADENLPAGIHQKTWNPGNMAPGTYFIQLESEGRMSVRKAMITK